ncbi:MAG: protein jag [Nitriliruptoraceae bacterium]
MSRTVRVEGTSLEEALRAALAEVSGSSEVEVELRGPGLRSFLGEVELSLLVTAAEDDGRDPGPEPSGAAPSVRPRSAGEEYEITPEELDEEADAAADFLEGLLDALDLPGDLRLKVHDDHVEVEVIDIGSGALIGRRGQTLDAIQELVRCSLQRQFQRRSRVKVDAEGYRARRLEKLLEKADEAIDLALDTGEPQRLEPMDVFERKAVHRLVAEVEGLTSRSQGREPARRIVIEAE